VIFSAVVAGVKVVVVMVVAAAAVVMALAMATARLYLEIRKQLCSHFLPTGMWSTKSHSRRGMTTCRHLW
jgi:hypothetical protein